MKEKRRQGMRKENHGRDAREKQVKDDDEERRWRGSPLRSPPRIILSFSILL